ncbi:hypothetical protein VL04_11070 [Chromobacterium violaceum]|nr:hypothetical protein CRN81_04560 [Chromobacterium violaceum]ATP31648.1 hypothetical protein CR207_04575 [Chromobacterium violaceum]KMN49860.1 hypothetical protein VK93_08655 [Chromobacterium violaceum]KMN85366.1 hypothetical protein VL02_14925 [Chromobacterium violaceum]KMN90224.1 hypothetical protein VL04_11070 [Chromobacterium violaceum]
MLYRLWSAVVLAIGLSAPVSASGLRCDHRASPEYPESARQNEVESVAKVIFRMDGTGHYGGQLLITFDRPLSDEYRDAFRSSIVAALRQYQCAPDTTLLETFSFQLKP